MNKNNYLFSQLFSLGLVKNGNPLLVRNCTSIGICERMSKDYICQSCSTDMCNTHGGVIGGGRVVTLFNQLLDSMVPSWIPRAQN